MLESNDKPDQMPGCFVADKPTYEQLELMVCENCNNNGQATRFWQSKICRHTGKWWHPPFLP